MKPRQSLERKGAAPRLALALGSGLWKPALTGSENSTAWAVLGGGEHRAAVPHSPVCSPPSPTDQLRDLDARPGHPEHSGGSDRSCPVGCLGAKLDLVQDWLLADSRNWPSEQPTRAEVSRALCEHLIGSTGSGCVEAGDRNTGRSSVSVNETDTCL